MNIESQFSMCENCKFDRKCCKMVPPMIFEFEKSKFVGNIFFENFRNNRVPLLKKDKTGCIFLENNRCQIYKNRPFNCRLFPFDIRKVGSMLYWVLLDFCYIPNNTEQQLTEFEKILSKSSEDELYLYIDYTTKSSCFRDMKYQTLREIVWQK